MDLLRLRYFARVAQCRSFRRASEELFIAQPALSRQVRLLEEDLGVRLLTRNARGVVPTEAGLALLYGTERLFDQTARLRAEVCSMAVVPSGLLRVGVQPAFAARFLSNIVARLRSEHPALHFHITEAFSERLRDLVVAGEADLAVVTALEDHPDLSSTPLYTEQSWLIGAVRHWKAPTRPVHPGYLKGQPVFAAHAVKPLLKRFNGLSVQNPGVELDAASAVRSFLQAGLGLYLGPPTMLWDQLQSGQFAGVQVRGLDISRYLIRRKDRPEGAAGAVFLTQALEEARRFAALRGSPVRV